MISLSLAVAIILPAITPLSSTHPPLQVPRAAAQEIAPQILSLVPYGSAAGTWIKTSPSENGVLIALLEDAAGQPLFVLDALMSPTNQIVGRLLALDYAGNPALSLPAFGVVGQARFPAEGPGSFSLVIYNPLEDFGYVYPHGQIEGVLQHGLRLMSKPGQGTSSLSVQSADTQAGEFRWRLGAAATEGVPLRGPTLAPQGPNLVSIASATSVGPMGLPLGRSPATSVIVCPWEPSAGAGRILARWTLLH